MFEFIEDISDDLDYVISPGNKDALEAKWDNYVGDLLGVERTQVEENVVTAPVASAAPVDGKKDLFLIGGALLLVAAVFMASKKKGKSNGR